MRKEILSEIQRMKFLVGYSKGRVISEQNLSQETPTGGSPTGSNKSSSSLGEKKQDKNLLKYHLRNDLLTDWRWVREEDFTQDGHEHYAIKSKKNLSSKKYYLSDEGIYYKIKNDKKTPLGEWYYKYNYPKNAYNFYLEPYKKEEKKPDETKPDETKPDETKPDQTTQNTGSGSEENQKGNMVTPVKGEMILCNKTVTETFCVNITEDSDILSPVSGDVNVSENDQIIIDFLSNNEKLSLMLNDQNNGITPIVKVGDKVTKGQKIGTLKKGDGVFGVIQQEDGENKKDVLEWFGIPSTQTNPVTTTKTTNEKMDFPIKVPLEKITFEKNDTDSIVRGYPDLDVISPIDGVLKSSSNNTALFIDSNDNKFQLYIYGVTNSLKSGDKVSKGQNLGKSGNYVSVEITSIETYNSLNLKDYFKF